LPAVPRWLKAANAVPRRVAARMLPAHRGKPRRRLNNHLPSPRAHPSATSSPPGVVPMSSTDDLVPWHKMNDTERAQWLHEGSKRFRQEQAENARQALPTFDPLESYRAKAAARAQRRAENGRRHGDGAIDITPDAIRGIIHDHFEKVIGPAIADT